MLSTGKKRLLLFIVLIIAIVLSAGYYFYNKGPVNIKTAAAQKVEAAAFYNAFISDSSAAQKSYSGKILIVSGSVSQTSLNQEGKPIILLKTAAGSGFINCTLDEKLSTNIKENQTIQLKGICSGLGEADEELGIQPDLYLERCIVQP
jgi:hypothetical protein